MRVLLWTAMGRPRHRYDRHPAGIRLAWCRWLL